MCPVLTTHHLWSRLKNWGGVYEHCFRVHGAGAIEAVSVYSENEAPGREEDRLVIEALRMRGVDDVPTA